MVTFVSGFISKEVAEAYEAREKADRGPHQGPEGQGGQEEGHPRIRSGAPAATPSPSPRWPTTSSTCARWPAPTTSGSAATTTATPTGRQGMEDVTSYPKLFAELVRRGWSDEDLGKLASGNILRAMRQAEAVAKRLQAARPPSTATIEELDGKR